MQLYNNLTKTKLEFLPQTPAVLKMYVCGLTVYADCHLGHGRLFIWFDVVARYFRALGYQVVYVRNITDIDDKIIKRAQELNIFCEQLTAQMIDSMHADEQALGVLPPNIEPRVTDNIPEIIAMIQRLFEKGYAYVTPNHDVCYRVRKFASYGALAHQDITELEAGARVETDTGKEDPLDFVLWKAAKPGEPAWSSPWGEGRPGWHIECSAMAKRYLGATLDIHGGGIDLLFPHHQNEIAQSEAANDAKLANYWMHIGFIQVNHEKMSKSLNNFSTIKEILTLYPGEVFRYFILASHYRSPVNFSPETMENAEAALRKLYFALRHLNPALNNTDDDFTKDPAYRDFHAAMQDDFNTPKALATLFDLVRRAHQALTTKQIAAAQYALRLLKMLGEILGLFAIEPQVFLQQGVDATKIERIITARCAARVAKNWSEADRLRDQLSSLGIALEDTPQGTRWFLEDRVKYRQNTAILDTIQ